jgi:hypothetical protein
MHSALKMLVLAPAIALSAACSKDKAADPSLNSDLGLAAQAGTPLDSVTAAEQMKAGTATTPAMRTNSSTATAPHKTTTTTRNSTSSSSATSGTSTAAAQPKTEIHKNTKRDAAIGAGAGAIIGAVTSKDKVKGAVIGGAAGAILGGVIGNNVDVKKKPVP